MVVVVVGDGGAWGIKDEGTGQSGAGEEGTSI